MRCRVPSQGAIGKDVPDKKNEDISKAEAEKLRALATLLVLLVEACFGFWNMRRSS